MYPMFGRPASADQMTAAVTRDQYADWEANYKPLENEYISWLTDANRIRNDINAAGTQANKQVDASYGVSDREQSRYGLELTNEQKQAQDRLRQLTRTKAMAGAKNMARGQIADEQLQGLAFMSGSMRQTGLSGSNMLSQAAASEANRDALNAQIGAQNDAATMNTIATLGMMRLMLSRAEYKRDIERVDDQAMLDLLAKIEVVSYRYRPDAPAAADLKGEHIIGVLANDMPAELLSADGQKVNMINVVGALLAANRALAERVKRLEREVQHG